MTMSALKSLPMPEIIPDLLKYNYDVNQKLSLRLLEYGEEVSEKSHLWFCHILNAHHVWVSRLVGQTPEFKPWANHEKAFFSSVDEQNYALSLLAYEENDLDRMLKYTNFQGETFENTVQDIFLHIVNHSTYHRGQIAFDLRSCGLEPFASDFIHYKRTGL